MIFEACGSVRVLGIRRARPSSIARPAAPTPGAQAASMAASGEWPWPIPHCTTGATRLSPAPGR